MLEAENKKMEEKLKSVQKLVEMEKQKRVDPTSAHTKGGKKPNLNVGPVVNSNNNGQPQLLTGDKTQQRKEPAHAARVTKDDVKAPAQQQG